MPTGPQRVYDAEAGRTIRQAAPTGKAVSCHWCGGSGADPYFGGQEEICQTCGGSGAYYEGDAKFMGDPRYRGRA